MSLLFGYFFGKSLCSFGFEHHQLRNHHALVLWVLYYNHYRSQKSCLSCTPCHQDATLECSWDPKMFLIKFNLILLVFPLLGYLFWMHTSFDYVNVPIIMFSDCCCSLAFRNTADSLSQNWECQAQVTQLHLFILINVRTILMRYVAEADVNCFTETKPSKFFQLLFPERFTKNYNSSVVQHSLDFC